MDKGAGDAVWRVRVSTSGAAWPAPCDIPLGPRASQPSGSAANFSRQPGLQKLYVVPRYSNDPPRAVAGSTFIPHTGSVVVGSA